MKFLSALQLSFKGFKKSLNNYIIVIFIVTAITATATATAPPSLRQPSKEKIESYKRQRDFSYANMMKPADNPWDRFWEWVGYKIQRLLSKTSYDYFWKPLFYIFIVLTLVFVIMKLFGVEIRSLFTKAPAAIAIPFEVTEENIHELDLEGLIAQAAERNNFRLAVRYLYLKLLKQLSDSGLIEWKPGKTNRMYLHELDHNPMRRSFEYLTMQFEYIWYGDFEVNDNRYRLVRNRFAEFGSVMQADHSENL